jgi:hypothetical protein
MGKAQGVARGATRYEKTANRFLGALCLTDCLKLQQSLVTVLPRIDASSSESLRSKLSNG